MNITYSWKRVFRHDIIANLKHGHNTSGIPPASINNEKNLVLSFGSINSTFFRKEDKIDLIFKDTVDLKYM